jgi:hypothetical protein
LWDSLFIGGSITLRRVKVKKEISGDGGSITLRRVKVKKEISGDVKWGQWI